MKAGKLVIVLMILIPVIGFGQLKKDAGKINISNTLEKGNTPISMLGFLDPSKFHMEHSFSVSYAAMGGAGIMMNTYLNTINYKFSDHLEVRTKLGIMSSPYNSLPNQQYMNDARFFGGAEVLYKPGKNTAISLRFESVPAGYFYQQGLYRNYPYYSRPSLFDE